ncbi:MAG: hypothetical protein HZA03_06500 [Nitrospinae bacterium]|nr:hypothetical protein [Nitrospinota bacterium]
MKRIFTLLLLALYAAPAAALTLAAAVDPPAATIGDHLRYTITARDAAGVELPLKLENPAPFELLDARADDTGGEKKVVFTLTVFKTGTLPLPAYSVLSTGADGKPETVSAPPVTVEIRSVLKPDAKEPAMMPIEDVADPVFDWKAYRWPVLAVLALVALLAALAHQLKKRARKMTAVSPSVPAHSPLETALAALEKIEAENLYAAGRGKEYFAAIADTVRVYLHAEYGVDAPEKTTIELEAAWPAALEDHRERVFYLLRTCDVAKFTKKLPDREDATSALAVAMYFVKNSPKKKSVPPINSVD